MKNLLLVIICLISIKFCFGQSIKLAGTIIDSRAKEPLPYGTIELFSLKTGTITDKNGKFNLEVTSIDHTADTIEFSYLGYEKAKISINDFLLSNGTIGLKEKPVIIDEVEITPKKYITAVLGITDKEPESMQYAGLFTANKGNFIKNIKKERGWFKSVSYYIHADGKPTTPFRVRIYSKQENGKPGKDILNENLIVSAKKSGWFTADISKYNIPFPEQGAFVMMEWINSGEEYYFEKEFSSRMKDGQTKTEKKRYYGQSLGVVSKKGGVVLWGNTLGNEWIPYDFNYKGKYPNAMIRAEIFFESDDSGKK